MAGSEHGLVRSLRRRLEHLLGVPFTGGNGITVLNDGAEAYPPMIQSIRGAWRTVDLATHTFSDGDIARHLSAALVDRARGGVRVRLLIDAVGGRDASRRLVSGLERQGVEVALFRRRAMAAAHRQNHRCQRRLLVVDGLVGYTGGLGIADDWAGSAEHGPGWRDTNVQVRGPAVDGLAAAFTQLWAEAGGSLFNGREHVFPHPAAGNALCQVVRGSAGPAWDDLATLGHVLIDSAAKRLRIATPYFDPDRDFIEAIVDAAGSGVQIDLLLPERGTDRRVAWLPTEATRRRLIKAGVSLAEHTTSVLSAHLITVDGVAAVIGATGIGRHVAERDEELALVVIDKYVVDALDRRIEGDLWASRRAS